ncbi:MAG TPA: sigma-70 family RNA polymerase sigma factor [Planctomycetota bacterium]|nr:sigma-70 family RNA polymerase sigma factor [Planctomycetota bacterium]
MDADGDALRSDELLAQLGWVRALAQRLVADPDVTDEVLQQVCLLALQRTPPDARTGPRLRAWLATATRRLAEHAGRSSARRQRREQAAARPEVLPSTIDVAVHREALRSLVEAMSGLEEAAYSLLVARYFEGRSVAEIAAQSGVSSDAVHQRLSRARQQLRARLQQLLDDDRSGRLRALLPVASLPGAFSGGTPTLGHFGGVLVAKTVESGIAKLVIGLVLLCCVVGGTWYAMGDSFRATPGGTPGSSPVVSAEPVAEDSLLPAPGVATAETLAAEQATATLGSPSSGENDGPPSFTFRGRVVDDAGLPLFGATVVYWPNELTAPSYGVDRKVEVSLVQLAALPHAVAGDDGGFEMTCRFVAGQGTTPSGDDPSLVAMADGYANRTHRCRLYAGGDYDAGVLALVPGGWFEGRVVDGRGQPVGGASVKPGNQRAKALSGVTPDDDPWLSAVFARTLSGADGRFRTGGLWEGGVQVGVSADGFLDLWFDDYVVLRPITAGRATDLGDVVLDSGVTLSGQVRDGAGAAIEGARVVAVPSGDLRPAWIERAPDDVVVQLVRTADEKGTLTDASGHFDVPHLELTNHSLVVSAAGCDPQLIDDLLPGHADVGIVLQRAATLRLDVTSRADGRPLPEAKVQAWRCSAGKSSPESIELPVVAGATLGSFVVEGLGSVLTRVTVSAPGHATQRLELAGATPPEAVQRGVALIPESVLAGRVVGDDGAPRPDAVLTLRPKGSEVAQHTETVHPDAAGHFEFRGVAAGDWTLSADADGWSPTEFDETLTVGETRRVVDIIVPSAAVVFGTCFDADGTPEAGTRIYFMPTTPGPGYRQRDTRSDAAGHYEQVDMPIGHWQVVRGGVVQEIDLAAGQSLQLDLHDKPETLLQGSVLRSDGTPVANAWVFVSMLVAPDLRHSLMGRTDENGHWLQVVPTPGPLDIVATLVGGGSSEHVTVDLVEGEQRTLDLHIGEGRVTGRVVLPGDVPLPSAIVRVLAVANDGKNISYGWVGMGVEEYEFGVATDSDGRFELNHLGPARYDVSVAPPGVRAEKQAPFELAPGQTVDLLIRVQRTGRISGHVTLASGVPVHDGLYLVADGPGGPRTCGVEAGRYDLAWLVAGEWRLTITEQKRVISDRVVTLEPGQELEVDLVAQP